MADEEARIANGLRDGAPLVGQVVQITGLNARPELNGATGTVTDFSFAQGRYVVRIEQRPGAKKPCDQRESLSIRPTNLMRVIEHPTSARF